MEPTETAVKVNVDMTGQFKLPPPNLRKKLSIPLKPKPTQTLLGGHALSSPSASTNAPEQKLKHFTTENLPEGIEILNSSSYVGFRCTCCDVKLTSEAILKRHVEGAEHQKKSLLKLNSVKKNTQQKQSIITSLESKVNENKTNTSQSLVGRKDTEKTVNTSPKSTLAEYLTEASQPIVGLDFVAETQLSNTQSTFYCKLCGITCSLDEIKEHIIGVRHCLMYLQMVEAKKIEEIRSQFKKKSERNQEILKFAAQVEKAHGRGTMKLLLPELLNQEPSKKTDSQDSEERSDDHSSVKRAIEEPSSSSRKKLSLSNEVHDSKSNENTKYYSSSDPNTKQPDGDKDKQAQKREKKRNRWGGFADPSILTRTQIVSSSADATDVIANTTSSLKECLSSPATNLARKTALLKPQPKKPLYKPPRSFLLPSDIINLTQVNKRQPSLMQAVPHPQNISQSNLVESVSSSAVIQSNTCVTTRDARPSKPQRRTRFDSVINAKPSVFSQEQTHFKSAKNEVRTETSQCKSQLNSVRNDRREPSQLNLMKSEATPSILQHQEQLNLARNLPSPSQQLKQSTTQIELHSSDPVRSMSKDLITGLLNHSELKGSYDTNIATLKHLSSFIISDESDAGNVMDVISSLTQAYLQYKMRALSNPIKELLVQSLKDGSEGLQIVLKHHGVNNMEPLQEFSDINNDTTRCASNVLRQFSSKWKEEPDESFTNETDISLEHDSNVSTSSRDTVMQENENSDVKIADNKLDPDDNAMANSDSNSQQQYPYNWTENKSSSSKKNSLTESSHGWNGLPLRSNSFDR